jgi:hypothetical protein
LICFLLKRIYSFTNYFIILLILNGEKINE